MVGSFDVLAHPGKLLRVRATRRPLSGKFLKVADATVASRSKRFNFSLHDKVKRWEICSAQLDSVFPDETKKSFIVPELQSEIASTIEAAAIRAIRQAELEYREAARKLMKAQEKLESARLIAEELSGRQDFGPEKFVDNSMSTATSFSQETLYEQSIEDVVEEDTSWRDSVKVVEAVFKAEEQRKEGLVCFKRAAEALRQRLTEEPVQASINDRHIELLDNGGQYQVAQWVISEVESCIPEGTSTDLVVSINLDLALQGCDPHLVQFLQDLPYDQVLGIKTSVKPAAPVFVDFCDGSSWESEPCDRALHGEDLETVFSQSFSRWPQPWKLEQLQAPAIDVDVLQERLLPETFQESAPSILLSMAFPKQLPLPLPWKGIPESFGKKELTICAASFSFVLVAMLQTCELTSLVLDACILGFVGVFTYLVACAAGAVALPLPEPVQKLVEERWPHQSKQYASWKSASPSNRPWDQLVLWMGTASAVLSSATLSAIGIKLVQLGASFLFSKLSESLPDILSSQLAVVDLSRMALVCLGIAGGNTLLTESMPYLVSSLMWMLLLLSVVIATSSVSLILVGYTSRARKS